MSVAPHTIFCCGNPLLDIVTTVDEAFLAKYNLKPNDAILADESHAPLFEEIEKRGDFQYSAGGATQNSCKIAQALLKTPKACVYVGSVGDDEHGAQLARHVQKIGVVVRYHVDKKTPTGVCACLLNGHNRSLVTNLGACNEYKFEHMTSDAITSLIRDAKIYYTAGFFQTVSPESIIYIGKHAAENNKVFCTNLSAPFLVQVPIFLERINATIPYVDVLFGNESEAEALAASNGWNLGKDMKAIAEKIGKLPKENVKRPRVVIITQGCDPTIVYDGQNVSEFPVQRIDSSLVIDTNGAGDAFVGGFIAKLALGGDLSSCIRAGSYAASVIIQHIGASWGDKIFELPA